jgi:hypothetical protein
LLMKCLIGGYFTGLPFAHPFWVRGIGASGVLICPGAAIFAAAVREGHRTSAANGIILAGEWPIRSNNAGGQSCGGPGAAAGFWREHHIRPTVLREGFGPSVDASCP